MLSKWLHILNGEQIRLNVFIFYRELVRSKQIMVAKYICRLDLYILKYLMQFTIKDFGCALMPFEPPCRYFIRRSKRTTSRLKLLTTQLIVASFIHFMIVCTTTKRSIKSILEYKNTSEILIFLQILYTLFPQLKQLIPEVDILKTETMLLFPPIRKGNEISNTISTRRRL